MAWAGEILQIILICSTISNSQTFKTLYEEVCNPYLSKQLDRYEEMINKNQDEGANMQCAKEQFEEVKWHKGKYEFLKSLEWLSFLDRDINSKEAQDKALMQTADGSWCACCDEFFFKLENTINYVWDCYNDECELPKFPRFLDEINSPERLRSVFGKYLGTVDYGYEKANAKALNNLVIGMVPMLYRGMPKEYPFHPGLKNALRQILDNEWQDKTTGFWGPRIKRESGVTVSPNLSLTFHIINLRGEENTGEIKLWPQIIDTLIAAKETDWPEGWLEEGKFSFHHSYDVVKIFRFGWPYVGDNKKKEYVSAVLSDLLRYGAEKLNGGDFNDPGSWTNEGVSYAVFFLDEIGYLETKNPFWAEKDGIPEDLLAIRKDTLEKLYEKILSLNYEADPELNGARKMLKRALKEITTHAPL